MIKNNMRILLLTVLSISSTAYAQESERISKTLKITQNSAASVNQSNLTVQKVASEEIDQSYFDHSAFDNLLQKYVKPIQGSTAVDYSGFQQDKAILTSYIETLSLVTMDDFDNWPTNHQLAFLINVYNAATIELILTEYPELDSIRDIRSPWKQKFINLFGDMISLDNVEHDMIRGSDRYNDPRIHFAVNCASIGCPALLGNAYRGDILDQQLEASTKAFLSDNSRNYVDNDRLYLSNIFKWYRGDFEKGWRDADGLAEFVALYGDAMDLSADQKEALLSGDLKIKHTSYDWNLNSAK